MNAISKGLCWAAAMIVVAVASRYATMDQGSEITLFTVLPIVAWMSLTGRGSCLSRRGG